MPMKMSEALSEALRRGWMMGDDDAGLNLENRHRVSM